MDVNSINLAYNIIGTSSVTIAATGSNADINGNAGVEVFGGNVAMIAGNYIRLNNTGTDISTQLFSNNPNAGNILLASGAAVTLGGSDIAPTFTITGGTTTGGYVDLLGAITTAGAANSPASNGGNIDIVYFGNSSNGYGVYYTGAINTGGSGTGSNGYLNIISNSTNGYGITTSAINTTGGSGGGGNVYLLAAAPVISGPLTIQNGSVISGSFSPGNILATNLIQPGTITAAGNVTINTNGSFNQKGIISANNVTITNGLNSITLAYNIIGTSSVTIAATGSNADINGNAGVEVFGGNVAMIAGNYIRLNNTGTDISTQLFSNSPNAGNILLASGAAVTLGGSDIAPTFTITGGTTTGGYVDLLGAITTAGAANSPASNGGNIDIVYFGNSSNGYGVYYTGAINTGGSGTGSNGYLNIISNSTNGYGITTSTINTTGGSGGGGNVYLLAAAPVISGPLTIQNGSVISGSFSPGNILSTNLIQPGAITAAGNVTINTNGSFNQKGIISATNVTITNGHQLHYSCLQHYWHFFCNYCRYRF